MYDSANFSCKIPSYEMVMEQIAGLLLSKPENLPRECSIKEHFSCIEKYYLTHENYEMLIKLSEHMKLHEKQWENEEKILAEIPVIDAREYVLTKKQQYTFHVRSTINRKNYIYDTHPIRDFKHTPVRTHEKYNAFLISLNDNKTSTSKSFLKGDLLYHTTFYAIYEKGKEEVMCFIQILVGAGKINTIQYSIKNYTTDGAKIIRDFIDEFAIGHYYRLNKCNAAYIKVADKKAETMTSILPFSEKLPVLPYKLVPYFDNDDYYIVKTSTGEKHGVLLHKSDYSAYDIVLGEKLLGSSDNFYKILSMLNIK